MTAKRNVSLKDIAQKLGLDTSSVSLALRGSAKISEKTRRRVKQIALNMGYRMNLAARSLRTAPQPSLGLVLPDSYLPLSTPVAVATIQELARLALQRKLLFHVLSESEVQRVEDLTYTGLLNLDVALVWGATPAAACEHLDALGRPYVVVDPSHPSYRGFAGNVIAIDNTTPARELTRLLIERGVRNLTFIQGCADHLGHRARWEACRREWKKHRPDAAISRVLLADVDDTSLRRLTRRPHAGLFCSDDEGAKRILIRLLRMGVRVPDDVRMCGFDADELIISAGLPTARFDSAALAQRAIEAVQHLLADRSSPPIRHKIPVEIVNG